MVYATKIKAESKRCRLKVSGSGNNDEARKKVETHGESG